MLAVLTHNGLKKVLAGKMTRPTTMTEEQWDEMDEKALSAIQICLSREVLREVINEKTVEDIPLQDMCLMKTFMYNSCIFLFALRMS